MTTQYSYPEHSDGNSSVVEDASVSETTTSSPSESVAAPVGEETFAQSSATEAQPAAEEQASQLPHDEQDERQNAFTSEQSEAQGVSNTDSSDAGNNTFNQSGGETMNETPGEQTAATTDNDNAAEFAAEIVAEISLPSSDEPALQEAFSQTGGIPVVEEDVRPFTEIIEEFRQSEARFNAALEEAQEDARGDAQADTHDTHDTPVASSSVEEVFVPEFTMPGDASQAGTLTSETNMEINTPATATPEAVDATPTPTTPAARPVSPLLRPATRLRAPRHSARQRDEARAAHQTPAQPSQSAPEASQPQPPVEAKAEPETQTTQVAEAAPVETPRPARRYRFDRPAQATTPAPATPPAPAVPTQNGNGLTNGHSGFAGRTPTVERETAQQPEQNAVLPTVAEPVVEKTPETAPVEPERRRKHGQERQRSKEHVAPQASAPETPVIQQQQTPLEVADVAALVNTLPTGETVAAANEEVAPEDLPPLEYADLQKASTRRRRRRHTNGASVATLTGNTPSLTPAPAASTPSAAPTSSTAPTAPTLQAAQTKPAIRETPAASTAPSALPQRPTATTPVTPTTPGAGQYSITSGFTVSQMNNGNENRGPFMGPEPSPARGTMAAQNVRSIRTDAQRTPAYPVRSTEATSASVNQLANIVAQAIQTQTDRMIAELRRSNQAPTNISVSMPPFPSTERVGVFVDVANLLYSARTLRMTVDFGKLLDFLRGNRRLVRAQAYCPTSPQPGDEQMFLQAVKGLGYRITTKNYKTFSSGAKKADLDLDLCMDVVRLVDGNAVDCVVLVSGDSDFMPMLDYCSDHGVRVEVAAFDEAMSATLRQSCDLFINLSMLDEIRA